MNTNNLEIERKFLIKGEFKKDVISFKKIKQGYLSSVPERIVRVRICGEKAFITIKGISNSEGTVRYEFEKQIDVSDAENLLKICEPGMIEKTRYIVLFKGKKFEIDVFEGNQSGLTVAEIELNSADEIFEKPEWLGEEVTGNPIYYNSNLSKNPISKI
jgi:adenylate cyclase